MNGSEILKVVIDTNVIFMALYNPDRKAAKVIELANKDKLRLFSPESVKVELSNVLKRELDFSDEQVDFIIKSLPITWVEKQIYEKALNKTKVKHKPDKPIEALSLILDCEILSADKHFKNRININKVLEDLE